MVASRKGKTSKNKKQYSTKSTIILLSKRF